MIAPLLEMYGKMTHIIYYADRTITVGFALGDMNNHAPLPQADPALATAAPTRASSTRPTTSALWGCRAAPSARASATTTRASARRTRRIRRPSIMARKKKLAEKNTGTTPKPTKPTWRGKHGGFLARDRAQDSQGEHDLGARGELRRHYKTLGRRHFKTL